jgi:hypothetical protein
MILSNGQQTLVDRVVPRSIALDTISFDPQLSFRLGQGSFDDMSLTELSLHRKEKKTSLIWLCSPPG